MAAGSLAHMPQEESLAVEASTLWSLMPRRGHRLCQEAAPVSKIFGSRSQDPESMTPCNACGAKHT